LTHPSYAVIGSEGSPPDEKLGALGTVIYPERSIARHLHTAATAATGKYVIVISHTPPRGVLDFAIRFGKRHIGSAALRQFLLKRRTVPLVVCGHVHYCGAQSKAFACSTVVNAASHDDPGAPGRVAIIELNAGKVLTVEWHLLWELCSIPGVGSGRQSRLNSAGVQKPDQLAEASPQDIAKAIKGSVLEAASIQARASSLIQRQIVLHSSLDIPGHNRAYLDIETDLLCRFIWMVGLHLEDENRTYSFLACTPQQERRMLTDMLEVLNAKVGLNLLSYSGCRMEQRMLTQRLAAYRLPVDVASSIRDSYFNIHACAAFPTQGLTLKEIAGCCGFKWRNEMNGFEAAALYGSGKLSKAKKQMLTRYNEDDLLALKCVLRHLQGMRPRSRTAGDQ
jgi:uncharacterized protein YprB with RNaseH-like and TPR domain